MREFIETTKALGHPTRVRILKLLEKGELCVCQLQELLGGAQSTVSKHLGILHSAGLIASRKDGLWTYYRLETQPTHAHNLAFLALLSRSLNKDPDILGDRAGLSEASCCKPE